jgi:hypothetical protein
MLAIKRRRHRSDQSAAPADTHDALGRQLNELAADGWQPFSYPVRSREFESATHFCIVGRHSEDTVGRSERFSGR